MTGLVPGLSFFIMLWVMSQHGNQFAHGSFSESGFYSVFSCVPLF